MSCTRTHRQQALILLTHPSSSNTLQVQVLARMESNGILVNMKGMLDQRPPLQLRLRQILGAVNKASA